MPVFNTLESPGVPEILNPSVLRVGTPGLLWPLEVLDYCGGPRVYGPLSMFCM